VNPELKEAIAAFVAASARHCLALRGDTIRTRLELHTAFHALTNAWDRHTP